MKKILGVEFGSTRIKSVLINEKGEVIASGAHDWENQLENGYWTYSLDMVWAGLQASYSDLLKNYGEKIETLDGIGISAMMHGYLAFDKNDELFTDIGDGALRLNLKAIPTGTNLNYINKVIVNSATEFCGTNEKLVVKFGLLVVMAQNNEIPFDIQRVRDETNAFAKNGFKPISHSNVYKEHYSPAYRVISKKYKELVEAVIALRNVATNMYPNLHFRSESYIYS